MKLKKHIKLKQNLPEEPMSEQELERYNALMRRVSQNEAEWAVAKRKVNVWKFLTPVFTFVCTLAITLTCIFMLTPKSPKDLVYNEDKIISQNSTLNVLNTDTKYFNLNVYDGSTAMIYLMYDSESKDKLYYSLHADIDESSIQLNIVINKNYNYKFELEKEPTVKQLTEYEITYTSESSRGDPQINYKGWIKVDTETVYFDYMQIPAMGDEAFFESVQQIIKVKK